MGSYYLNSIQLSVFIIGIVEFFLLHLLTARKKFLSFFFKFQPSIKSHSISTNDSKNHAATNSRDLKVDQRDAEIVLSSLGMVCNSEEARFPEKMDGNDIFNLFEENNPSLDEVKEAFDVFDCNKDGFIDAKELQKVLCALGLKEGLEIKNCGEMIRVFDENGDGRIDFDEFVKFMESSFC